jgi:hypothetical protein
MGLKVDVAGLDSANAGYIAMRFVARRRLAGLKF